jgi:hypothetical protein
MDLGYWRTGDYALNFLALGSFSPLRIRSAPAFLLLAGQPYLGPNTLFQSLQEELPDTTRKQAVINTIERMVFISDNFFRLNEFQTMNIISPGQ